MELCKKKKAADKFCHRKSVGTVPRSALFIELKAGHLLSDTDMIIKFKTLASVKFTFGNSWVPPLAAPPLPSTYAALKLLQGQDGPKVEMWNLRVILQSLVSGPLPSRSCRGGYSMKYTKSSLTCPGNVKNCSRHFSFSVPTREHFRAHPWVHTGHGEELTP